jgi:hypothetical protein
MKSATEVIKNELEEQFARGTFSSYTLTKQGVEGKKQFCAKVESADRTIDLVIGTIDSFVYAVRGEDRDGNDMFVKIMSDIMEGSMNIQQNGQMRYAQQNIVLSEKCLIVVDEAQDLEDIYIRSFNEILKKTNMDIWIIGDLLQSIMNEENLFKHVENNKHLYNIEPTEACTNVCLRFHNEKLMKLVNEIVRFKDYKLPEIQGICGNRNCSYSHDYDDPVHIDYLMPDIYSCSRNPVEVEKYLNKIRSDMEEKIKKYGYLPNNFCFIFPIVSATNEFIVDLKSYLTDFWDETFAKKETYSALFVRNMEKNAMYWKSKLLLREEDDEVKNYVFHHTASSQGSINLAESTNCTRIMSIHASKGQGCECVYFLGLCDETMSCFCDKIEGSLVFESLLHVGLTRSKKYLWVGISNNKKGGEIYKRFKGYGGPQEVSPDLRFKIKTKFMVWGEEYKKLVPILCGELPHFMDAYTNTASVAEATIDYSHHIIRCTTMHSRINLIFYMDFGKKGAGTWAQYKQIQECTLKRADKGPQYRYYMKQLIITKPPQKKTIPIMCEGFKCKSYTAVSNEIYDLADRVHKKIKMYKKEDVNEDTKKFNVFECLMHHHLIEMVHKPYKQTLHIIDIYRLFISKNTTLIEGCITNHYSALKQLDDMMRYFADETVDGCEMKELSFDTKKSIYIDDDEEDVSINIELEYDYYSENENFAVCVYLSPQFNSMNYEEILAKILVQDYLLKKKKKQGYKVFSYIFTFDNISPIFVDFKNESYDKMTDFVKQYLCRYYDTYNQRFFSFSELYNKTFQDLEKIINKTLKEKEQNKKRTDKLPEYIRQYYKNKDEGKKSIPNRAADLDRLNRKIANIIDSMFSATIDETES